MQKNTGGIEGMEKSWNIVGWYAMILPPIPPWLNQTPNFSMIITQNSDSFHGCNDIPTRVGSFPVFWMPLKLGILYPIIYCFIDDVPIKPLHLFGIAMFFCQMFRTENHLLQEHALGVLARELPAGQPLQDSPGADPTKQLAVDQPLSHDPFIVGIFHFMGLFFHLLGSWAYPSEKYEFVTWDYDSQ